VQQLREVMVQEFNRQVDSGAIDKAVQSQVEKFCKSVIESSLSSWGEVSKALEKRIKDGLLEQIERFSLEQYNALIIKQIKERIEKVYVTDARAHLNNLLDDVFRVPKAKYKLSEIAKEIRGDKEEHEASSLHIDRHTSLAFVYIDAEPSKRDYSCEWHLTINLNDSVLSSARRKPYSSEKARSIRPDGNRMDATESLLFQMMIHGTQIEMDDDEAEALVSGDCY